MLDCQDCRRRDRDGVRCKRIKYFEGDPARCENANHDGQCPHFKKKSRIWLLIKEIFLGEPRLSNRGRGRRWVCPQVKQI